MPGAAGSFKAPFFELQKDDKKVAHRKPVGQTKISEFFPVYGFRHEITFLQVLTLFLILLLPLEGVRREAKVFKTPSVNPNQMVQILGAAPEVLAAHGVVVHQSGGNQQPACCIGSIFNLIELGFALK